MYFTKSWFGAGGGGGGRAAEGQGGLDNKQVLALGWRYWPYPYTCLVIPDEMLKYFGSVTRVVTIF